MLVEVPVPDDPHSECRIQESHELWGDDPHERPVYCAVHLKLHELVRAARYHEGEAERCGRRGYPLNAWSCMVDARTAWGAVAVYFLIWALDPCPANAEWLREQGRVIDVEPSDDELAALEAAG